MYNKTDKGWTFTDGGGRVMEMTRIAVAYAHDGLEPHAVLLKHGELEMVEKYCADARQAYLEKGMQKMANSCHSVEATHASEADLNHVLDTSALPASHFQRLDPNYVKRLRQILRAGPSFEM